MTITELLTNKSTIFAVVGASNDEAKYGYRVYKFLKSHGYKVYPVNPTKPEIQGDKAFTTIADLPEKPDVLSVIIPPQYGADIVQQAAEQGINTVWFQPGAESDEAVKLGEQLGIEVIHHKCILIEGSRV